jgi:hypothetical protein
MQLLPLITNTMILRLLIVIQLQVDELALHNEYQLRLKDMNYSEKLKEITEKFTQDLEQSKTRYEVLVCAMYSNVYTISAFRSMLCLLQHCVHVL